MESLKKKTLQSCSGLRMIPQMNFPNIKGREESHKERIVGYEYVKVHKTSPHQKLPPKN